jgi:hypothetical protein
MDKITPWLAVLGLLLADGAAAATKPAPPAARTAKAPARKPAPPEPPAASPEQLQAAARVFYGIHDCELGQTVEVAADTKHPGYVDVRYGKAVYLMKPVLSSTGAIRLEDVKGKTLLVQIATKSMLMDVQAGRRLVDECVGPGHRNLIQAARLAAAAAAASAASAAASSATPPVPASAPAEAAPASAAASDTGAR